MASKRQKQVANLIQETLSEVFQRDCMHLFGKALISPNYIKLSPDLGVASVYLSIFNGEEGTLEEINNSAKKIRYFLSQRLRNNLRKVPELRFFIDDIAEYSDNINKILNNLDIPSEDE